jgi:hypothetical protein
MATKLTTISVLGFTLVLLVACASGAPEPATPTTLPPTATPTPLPPTATPTPLPPTATPTPLPPTATPTPVESIAGQVEDLVGVWKTSYEGDAAYWQFKADGTFKVARTVENLGSGRSEIQGTVWFEGTVLNITDRSCRDDGTYEVRVHKQGDKPIRLVFKKMEDPCWERVEFLKQRLRWVES